MTTRFASLIWVLVFLRAVGGSWPGNPDATTAFPQQMLVDYVRVYQHRVRVRMK